MGANRQGRQNHLLVTTCGAQVQVHPQRGAWAAPRYLVQDCEFGGVADSFRFAPLAESHKQFPFRGTTASSGVLDEWRCHLVRQRPSVLAGARTRTVFLVPDCVNLLEQRAMHCQLRFPSAKMKVRAAIGHVHALAFSRWGSLDESRQESCPVVRPGACSTEPPRSPSERLSVSRRASMSTPPVVAHLLGTSSQVARGILCGSRNQSARFVARHPRLLCSHTGKPEAERLCGACRSACHQRHMCVCGVWHARVLFFSLVFCFLCFYGRMLSDGVNLNNIVIVIPPLP